MCKHTVNMDTNVVKILREVRRYITGTATAQLAPAKCRTVHKCPQLIDFGFGDIRLAIRQHTYYEQFTQHQVIA